MSKLVQQVSHFVFKITQQTVKSFIYQQFNNSVNNLCRNRLDSLKARSSRTLQSLSGIFPQCVEPCCCPKCEEWGKPAEQKNPFFREKCLEPGCLTLGRVQSWLSCGKGSFSKTSRIAPEIHFSFRAWTSSSSGSTFPRPMLIKTVFLSGNFKFLQFFAGFDCED